MRGLYSTYKNYIPLSVRIRLGTMLNTLRVLKFGIFKWLVLSGNAKYAYFQKKHYDYLASRSTYAGAGEPNDHVVGTYGAQNEWKDYDDYILRYIDGSFRHKIALDFATGPGRNIVKYHDRFLRLDGVDISQNNIENAKQNLGRHNIPLPRLYVNNGKDLAEIPSETYDFIMSTIAMQHICVYDTRFNLLSEFYRTLKPGGRISIQMGYGTDAPNSVPYYANDYMALTTNGMHDTQVESPDVIGSDLEKIGFKHFEYWIRPSGPKSPQKEWIYFTATK